MVAVADSRALLPNSAGVNYGGNVISYDPAPEGEQADDRVKSTIIHEVAHYYWLWRRDLDFRGHGVGH